MLYKRDFSFLTISEIEAIRKAEEYRASKKNDAFDSADFLVYHDLLPDAFYFNSSLFPNNYLHSNFSEKLKDNFKKLKDILNDPNSNEVDILSFINNNQAYFFLESLYLRFYTGNHEKYLFKEFPLPPDYRADYLMIGKNSMGYEFIFVEFEHPNKHITLKDGSLGKSFRNGLQQIEDWESWLDSNFTSLVSGFKKAKNKDQDLPSEFYELDNTRIHYLVIAGRRNNFNDKTYRLRRRYLNQKIHLYHYDNLLDDSAFLIEDKEKCLPK